MADSFFMRLYTKEFLSDSKVRALAREHRSDLVDLWCHCDQEGGIPNDMILIGRMLGITKSESKKTMQALAPFFRVEGDRLVSPRLQAEHHAREEFTAGKRKGAEITNAKRNAEREEKKANADAERIAERIAGGVAQGSPVNSQQSVKEPLSPQGGSRRRRSSAEILQGFTPEAALVVESLRPIWRKEDPADGRKITVDPAKFGQRVLEILRDHPEVTPELLIEAGKYYLGLDRSRFQAPQWFFGVGRDGKEAEWVGCVRLILTRKAQEPKPLEVAHAC